MKKKDNIDDEDQSNQTIRKKQSRKHNKSKKIFISPKVDTISISHIKKQLEKKLEKKLKNNKNIKKQYQNNEIDKKQVIKYEQNPKIIQQFKQIDQNRLILKLFFAEWCGHCQDFKPIWFELKEKYKNKINFEEIDCTNYNPNLDYVKYFPTIALYDKNKNYIQNYDGDRSKNSFNNFLNYLNN
jgi:thiol-disulfide isomerase/thioredoxin